MTSGKNFLFSLVGIFFVFTTVKFYSFYTEYSTWQYADWLINYQGGLVRRGLIGEILFRLHKFTSVDLDILIFLFVTSLYVIFSYYLLKSIKYIENSNINILIFLSPAFFIYPIMNSEVVGRKDILLLALISSFVFIDKKINQKFHFSILILVMFFLSLSHSAFAFYMPYFIFLYILTKNRRGLKITFKDVIIPVLFLVVLILFINSLNGTEYQINQICDSVKKFVAEGCTKSGQIFHLASGVEYRFAEKFKIGEGYISNYLIIYTISLILVFFFITSKLINSKFKTNLLKKNNLNPFLIFLILFLFTIPVYILGRDWGRYIYISYSCSFFIYIYCIKNDILIIKDLKILDYLKFRKIFFIIFVFFYSFFWTFPFYDAKNFKLTLKKPAISILKKLN